MLTPLLGAALPAFAATEELSTSDRPEVNSHTFIGLGLMAMAIVVIWLIRRLRA